MTQEESTIELITAQEAVQLFVNAGLSAPTFRRRVNDKQIDSVLPEGRQRGAKYPKDQVLAAIGGGKAKKGKKKIKFANVLKPTTFSKATVQDMPEVGALLETFFTKIKISNRIAWIEKNPNVCCILRTTDQIVGCAFIMPLPEEKILRILNAQIKPPTRTQDIAEYQPGEHYNLYIRSVVVLQSVSKIQKRYWGAKLISEIIKEIVSLGERGIIIDKIYAQTDSRHVENLLKMIGFSQLVTASENRNYMLDVANSGSIYARKYRKALSSWLQLGQ